MTDFLTAPAADAFNGLFATLHARSKDSPAKTWWHAEAMHPAIFRALKMNRQEDGAIFAAAAFRLHRSEAGARILAAFPTPRILGPVDEDWLGIHTVLSWDPRSDTAEVVDGDPNALVGTIPIDSDSLSVFTSPFAFFRACIEARARFFVQRSTAFRPWQRRPDEPDLTPGALLIGAPDKVRWPLHHMPEHVIAQGIDPKALNRAMLRQAKLPRATAASDLRRAA